MREFKFRAWDTKLNIMIFEDSDFEAIEQKYNDSCYWAGERYPCICPEAMFGFKMDRFIKMQYTGLKDKNGVEIYEYMEIDDNFEVSFKDGCYVLTNISNGDIILLYNYLRDKNGQVAVTKEYTKI